MQNIIPSQITTSTASILGRVTAGSGNAEILTATQATALLDLATTVTKGLLSGTDKTKLDALSGSNTGDETYSTITSKLAGGSGGGTINFLRADGTFAAPPGGGGGTWGSITGTLSSQTDLQNALNAKAPTASPTFTGTVIAPTINNATGVSLQHNGSTKMITDSTGLKVFGNRVWVDNAAGNAYYNASASLGSLSGYSLDIGDDYRGQFYAQDTTIYVQSETDVVIQSLGASILQHGYVTRLTTTANGVSVTGSLSANGVVTGTNIVQGMSSFCSGKPANNERLAGGVAPYSFTITQANCSARASVAATGAITFTIRNNGSQIGTVSFANAATLGTYSITSAEVASGAILTIEAPADATNSPADIAFVIRS
jgi:hypothetical protein